MPRYSIKKTCCNDHLPLRSQFSVSGWLDHAAPAMPQGASVKRCCLSDISGVQRKMERYVTRSHGTYVALLRDMARDLTKQGARRWVGGYSSSRTVYANPGCDTCPRRAATLPSSFSC